MSSIQIIPSYVNVFSLIYHGWNKFLWLYIKFN
nr:MAG TPA: hypothetical protein [Caudoviricetes sp.]